MGCSATLSTPTATNLERRRGSELPPPRTPNTTGGTGTAPRAFRRGSPGTGGSPRSTGIARARRRPTQPGETAQSRSHRSGSTQQLAHLRFEVLRLGSLDALAGDEHCVDPFGDGRSERTPRRPQDPPGPISGDRAAHPFAHDEPRSCLSSFRRHVQYHPLAGHRCAASKDRPDVRRGLTPRGGCGPWPGAWRGSPAPRGCAYAGESRGSSCGVARGVGRSSSSCVGVGDEVRSIAASTPQPGARPRVWKKDRQNAGRALSPLSSAVLVSAPLPRGRSPSTFPHTIR